MKRFFLRIENWLLIVPLVLLLGQRISFPHSGIAFIFYDTFYIIASFHFLLGVLLLGGFLCGCHLLLRIKQRRNKKILVGHVTLTVLLLLYFFGTIFFTPAATGLAGQPRRYYDGQSLQHVYPLDPSNSYFAITALVFVLMQALFILYTSIRLIMKK